MNKCSMYLLWFTLALVSCSKKTLTFSTQKGTPPKLNINEVDFEYFSGKAKMVLQDGNKKRDVKANIRIQNDSVIWMTFSVVGVQGGKALINKDSITIVSTVDKEYFVFEYAELSKRFGIDINYEIIQSAMLGNLIVPRKEADVEEPQNSMHLLKQRYGEIDIKSFINIASMKIERVELGEKASNNALEIDYSNFQAMDDQVFPYTGSIRLYYKTEAGLVNTTIIFEYNKAEIENKELNFPFNIPKKYARR